jgi:hypothetical protein
VSIDQAGEERGIAEIDGFGASRKCRLIAGGDDLTIGDDDEAG